MRPLALILALLIMGSCDTFLGEVVATIPVQSINRVDNPAKESLMIDAQAGDQFNFWTKMDFSYLGNPAMDFKIIIYQNNQIVDSFVFDPRDKDVTMMEKRIVNDDKTDWSFQGKGPEWIAKEGGQYKITVALEASQTAEIELNEAAILIRK